jgi:hypothetical protein
MKTITHIMETSPLRHQTFKAATLQNATVAGLWNLILGLWTTKRIRTKLAILWVVSASVFVLCTPTWLNAMSGYTADVSVYVQDRSSLLVPAENFLPVIYTVHDGARLGEGFVDDAHITVPWSGGYSLSTTDRYACSALDIINSTD